MAKHRVHIFLESHGIPEVTKVVDCGPMIHHDVLKQCVCSALCRKQQLVHVNESMYLMVASSCLKYLHNEAFERGHGHDGNVFKPIFDDLDDNAYLKWCAELGKKYEEKQAKIELAHQEERVRLMRESEDRETRAREELEMRRREFNEREALDARARQQTIEEIRQQLEYNSERFKRSWRF